MSKNKPVEDEPRPQPGPKKRLSMTLQVPSSRLPHDDLIKPIESVLPIVQPSSTRSKINRPKIGRSENSRPNIDPQAKLSDGFLAVPHTLIDHILPTLSTTEQVVLLRLFRLSRGFNRETCEVGQGALQKACNITRNTLKTTIASLIEKGYIAILEVGSGPESSLYKVNIIGVSKIDRPEIDRSETGRPEHARPENNRLNSGRATNEEPGSISDRERGAKITPITNMNSSTKNQHTHTGGGGGSRFTLKECRRYADHLHKTGQGVDQPGPFAKSIFKSGSDDEFIEIFLNPPAKLDVSQCPDCRGVGHFYVDPANPDKGVKPCKHEWLKQ